MCANLYCEVRGNKKKMREKKIKIGEVDVGVSEREKKKEGKCEESCC